MNGREGVCVWEILYVSGGGCTMESMSGREVVQVCGSEGGCASECVSGGEGRCENECEWGEGGCASECVGVREREGVQVRV